ncbi:MAG: class I SAM-dependent methyltransferase [Treponemataceae bacterium]|nr:class I SAM-dependent methyltransferase [Treponemataceae bacterium]
MKNKTEASRLAYNKIASEYDVSKEGRYTRFHIGELSDTIDLRDGDVVLDVACGNGTLLRELSKRADIQAHGIDVAEEMIRAAKSRYQDMHFEARSCCPLAWNDGSVDIITVCCAFHHFENPQEFADECRRVLKKGGAVYVAEPNFGAALRFLANTIWFPFAKSGDVKVYGAKTLAAFFYAAGFQAVRAYKKGAGLFLKAEK